MSPAHSAPTLDERLRLSKAEPSKADFNANLPETGGTDELGILLVLDQISRCRAELGIAVDEPQESVSIQQQGVIGSGSQSELQWENWRRKRGHSDFPPALG